MRAEDEGAFRALAGGSAELCAYGDVRWIPLNGCWRGLCETASALGALDDRVELVFMHRPRIPWQPTLALTYRGDCVARVDVNGDHRGRRFTHLQTRTSPSSAFATIDLSPSFLPVPDTGSEASELLERIFRAAAGVLQVDATSVMWADPPEGDP